MSYHLLHVLRPGVVLARSRGFIQMRDGGEVICRLPLEDIRAVIIAARGVTITSQFLSGVLEEGGIILHCDAKYRPCGISTPSGRVIDPRSLYNQGNRTLKLHSRLWSRILKAKIRNQAAVLDKLNVSSPGLKRISESTSPDESRAARFYWKRYFPALGEKGSRRRADDTPLNRRLNYGYAVVSALCHRSIMIHGLCPLFGMHHIPRYRSHALVYDLVEPLRPFVDGFLAEFIHRGGGEMKNWCKEVGRGLVEVRVSYKKKKVKLLEAIDRYISSVASCYADKSVRHLWVPANEKKRD